TPWLPDNSSATVATGSDTRETGAETTGRALSPGLQALRGEVYRMEERLEAKQYAIGAFTEELSVTPSGEANVLSISYTYPDPARAARFVNAVIDRYVEQHLRKKLATRET